MLETTLFCPQTSSNEDSKPYTQARKKNLYLGIDTIKKIQFFCRHLHASLVQDPMVIYAKETNV